MDYGFTITKQGWKLLAKLLTGSQLEITRVMVGSGKVPAGANPSEMMDLVQPVALATSTIPQVENEQVSFIVEYRSDLNGGLKEGFWLNEFGVFANDPDAGEVLLYYATMGDYPQYVSAFTGGSVDIRRYPVSIALSESPEVHLDYPAGALVTAEEMAEALHKQGVPAGGFEGQMLIKANNKDYATEWGPWPSNPNLLLNWDFRNPVNRNGKREYTGAGYSIDRWQTINSNANYSLVEGGLEIDLKSNTSSFQQIINIPYKFLKGKKVTFSLLMDNNILLTQTVTIPTTTPNVYTDIGCTTNNRGCDVYLSYHNAVKRLLLSINKFTMILVKLIAIKLEIGDQQTLAHQDTGGNWVLNDPPNYDLQYALCSQYSPVTGEFVGSQHSNPNLLDNWYFADPINQRGQTEYIETGYSIDRWRLNASDVLSMNLEPDNIALSVSDAINGYPYIQHTFEYPKQYIGKQMTFSALIKNPDGLAYLLHAKQAYTGSGFTAYENKEGTIQEDYTLVQCTGTLPANSTNFYLFLYVGQLGTISGTLHVKAIKAELGSVQTLAHKEGDTWVLNDSPPNKALELAKCQRYQNMIANGSLQFIGTGTTVTSTDTIYLYISVPVTMRANPMIEFSNLSVFYGNSNTKIAVVSVENVFHTSNSIRLSLKTATPVPANTVYQIGIIGTDSGNLLLNANL